MCTVDGRAGDEKSGTHGFGRIGIQGRRQCTKRAPVLHCPDELRGQCMYLHIFVNEDTLEGIVSDIMQTIIPNGLCVSGKGLGE